MTISVQNNNVMNVYNSMSRAQSSYNSSVQQISSGSRINNAANDVAGMFISNQMNGQIRGLVQGNKNASDGVSIIQTAEGALNSVHHSLGRMKELAVQASNGILTDEDRAMLNEEFSSLKEEISSIADNTHFNGKKLLDGSLDTSLLVGANSDEIINLQGADMSLTGLNIENLSIDNMINAQDAIEAISKSVEKVSSQRVEFGTHQNRLEDSINNTNNAISNLTASDSQISDIDIALAVMKMARENITYESQIAMMSQANQSNQMALALLR
ncbi:flagellin N-terminal helical domain-containing protein [Oceanirhabdus sp. W0125-5]|uniref:flagellin N-terminal helical domain-containing protein n=1 Tax=Oceanirhabdus sp. W0125-5 TaxID=2999116 RepID=UPI0022F2F9CC|nr:flagellin [Oceanirhabdus sp. W0125-5]WBW95446.1 flagellin [Oceanirhabdus sp. W0125-5]